MKWMMWQSDRPLAERVAEAAAYFEKKYRRKAIIALAHPKILGDGGQTIIQGVRVIGDRRVLENCIWIGDVDESDYSQ